MPDALLAADTPLYVVFNPASGAGQARDARSQIGALLQAAGRRHELIPIDDPREIEQIAARAAQLAVRDRAAVVVAAGDGTINALAQAVWRTGRPFGIVPQGTFNYSSRAHGIPLDTEAAARALLNARIKPVQLGLLNDRVFLVNASVGLYPELLQDRERYKREYGRKRSIALWSALMTLLRQHRQLALEVEHDGQRELVRTPTVFVGNNPLQLEQVGLPEAQDVQRQRGLAAVIVRPVGTGRLFWLAARGALGQLGEDRNVMDFSFRSMTVRPYDGYGSRGIKVAVDGETLWLRPPLRFAVAPHPLQLMVPADQPP